MKKLVLSVLGGIVFSLSVNAQKAATAIYGEIGGPGLASVNLDMRFAKKEDGLGFRAGVGGFSIGNTSLLVVPLGINYIASKNSRHYFETGVGVSFVSYKERNNYSYSDDDFFRQTFGHLTLGYRLQRKDGGFFFRAAVNPVFGSFGFFPFYGGVGFGYKF